MSHDTLEASIGRATQIVRAMANRQRLLILIDLADGESAVNALCARLGMGQSAVSQHLARLRSAGLVTTRREAQTIHYALAGDTARRVLDTLDALMTRETRTPIDGRPAEGMRPLRE
ncbi:transcriptional regulator, ArsR family [Limimonas halophila]|uniref:Transcriptional regulator, ArsR family n=1 Tax=Limimonas halophila TaxID=1082479 RepID=A0A1G7T7M6_9PROT|nr:metalloregulator ArsR/SmtB family transcription factor [Limimonas halophila]SDG31082.1 transcriptional regulator, ArsR family [Limimonas halophila]